VAVVSVIWISDFGFVSDFEFGIWLRSGGRTVIRLWIGTALLAGSWLLGLSYFQPASQFAWVCAVVAATVLLSGLPVCWPDRRQMIAAVLLLLPAVWLLPLPYRAIPLLIAGGLILQLAPVPRNWPRKLGHGAAAAGLILLIQSLVLQCYAILTARAHELPGPLAGLAAVAPRLLGIDVTADGATLAMRSIHEMRRFGATWELLLDPATLCFFVGGLAMLGLLCFGSLPRGKCWTAWWRGSLVLLAVTLAWAFVRVAVVIALILHRALLADAIAAPNVADVLVNSWIHILLLAGPVLLAARLIRKPSAANEETDDESNGKTTAVTSGWSRVAAPLLVGAGVTVVAVLFQWDPVGRPKNGRIMFVERHSTWEPTTVPYRNTLYGEAGSYNYAGIFEYCGQYYQMSRVLESDLIDDETLGQCDVLVIKTPTSRYSEDEVAAVVRFVRQGGSLLMIGDHTNVFNMNTYLNDISRYFGFTFRNDLLFRVTTPYKQKYRPPRVAHPIVGHVPPMNFAVSCSIDPGRSAGRMVIRSTGLWNLPPAYQESNYHPQAEYAANMQYGAWCQLWSTRYGKGRVVAFADSTLFSNFCVFQEGKAELLMGMVQWLNHRSPFDQLWVRLSVLVPCWILGVVSIALGLRQGWRQNAAWLLMVAAGLAGWTVGSVFIIASNLWAMPIPKAERPMKHVVIDRKTSEVPLFTGAFEDAKEGRGYGMLEQWIPRIGNFISRRTGEDVFIGDGLVVICPTRSVDRKYRERLARYVESGGQVLVFDSIDLEGSTANSILWPFGLSSNHSVEAQDEGTLKLKDSDLELPLQASCEIIGGEPLAWLGDMPVAAQVRHGEGTITAIGFGTAFKDSSMNFHWLPEPDEDMLNRYEVLYALLRTSLPWQPTASGLFESNQESQR